MEVINLKEQLNRYRSSVGKDTIPFDSVLHDYDFAVARVVNNSVAQINNYITIDKGRAEGIEPEMGVVDQNGVVGIINVVGEHHSVAISVLNPKLRLSCKVKGSDYFGSLVWDAVSPSLRRIRGDASACGVCSGRYDCHERLFVCVSRRNYGGYNQRL